LLKDARLIAESRESGFVYYRLADDARSNGHAPLWASARHAVCRRR
jgi:hypothetical protein